MKTSKRNHPASRALCSRSGDGDLFRPRPQVAARGKTRRRRGMTLVELLVVVSIMVMLVAISVPTFKPMLESQRSAGGARAVSLALQRARVKAVYEKRTCGVEFVRFHDGNAPDVAVQMRLMRSGYNFVEIDEDIRVRIENGYIVIYRFNPNTWAWAVDNGYWSKWDEKVKPGYKIQLGRQGRFYDLADDYDIDRMPNRRLAPPYGSDQDHNPDNNLNLPSNDIFDSGNPLSALEVNVLQTPRPTLSPVVALPHGTIVDLQFSSFDNPFLSDGSTNDNFRSFCFTYPQNTSGATLPQSGNVGIMFSPAGHVDRCYYHYIKRYQDSGGDDAYEDVYNDFLPHGGLFYLCIGEWDRQGTSSSGDTLAEDGRNNLITPSNFWVTVNPRNGQVRVVEMAAVPSAVLRAWESSPSQDTLRAMFAPARKYATDRFTEIGGF